jgi:chemotaxis protein methyltransferase CheR
MLLDTGFNLTEADFRRVSELVYRHCGINLHDGKEQLVRARMAKRLREGGFRSLSDYLDHVLSDASGTELATLIDAMSTNLTSFYRESDHFIYLAETALPELIRQKTNSHDNRIRLWSAGCSTGQEPCTLAMTLLDAIQDAARWDIRILATDISTKVLKAARTAFYDKSQLEALPEKYRRRFFHSCVVDGEKGFAVTPEALELISYRHLNLMEPWPFTGPFDFIFCRNVMIYFDKPTQEKLINRFWDLLVPNGVLFTGHSESLTGVQHKFHYLRPTIYRK